MHPSLGTNMVKSDARASEYEATRNMQQAALPGACPPCLSRVELAGPLGCKAFQQLAPSQSKVGSAKVSNTQGSSRSGIYTQAQLRQKSSQEAVEAELQGTQCEAHHVLQLLMYNVGQLPAGLIELKAQAVVILRLHRQGHGQHRRAQPEARVHVLYLAKAVLHVRVVGGVCLLACSLRARLSEDLARGAVQNLTNGAQPHLSARTRSDLLTPRMTK